MTKEESLKNAFYLRDYKPLKRKIHLKNHEQEIIFEDAWAETQWFYNSDICLLTKPEKSSGYNIVIEFKKSIPDTFLFSLSPVINGVESLSSGGIWENKKEIRLKKLPDILWLQVYEKNPQQGIGWKAGLKGELIGFVKK